MLGIIGGVGLIVPSPASAESHPAAGAITAALDTLAKALKAGDAVAAASIFAVDALIVAPGEFVRGRDAIAARYTKRFAARKYLDVAFKTMSIVGSGDRAIEVGTSQSLTSDAGAPAKPSTGRYLTVWHKNSAGVWEVESDAPYVDPSPA
ncbi:MAG: hypothetical protein NVSMB64_12160 [Candidatus Velthaea sp.]